MSWILLNQNEQDIILQCLVATTEGPFFPEWEFSILMGYTREEVKEIIDKWNELDKSSDEVIHIIVIAIANLIGYPHRQKDAMKKYISADEIILKEIINKLKL